MFFRATCSLFELSIGSAVAAFNMVSREMISALFNEYVYMPMSEEEQITECKGFIENYQFPCVDAWDGLQVLQVAHIMHVRVAAQTFSKILLQKMLYLIKLKTWIMKLGEIPLDTVGDAFPRFVQLLEIFNENTQDPKERYYNKKLCSVRAVAEICYVMLKSRLRRIYKRCICKLENSKFIVLAQRWIQDSILGGAQNGTEGFGGRSQSEPPKVFWAAPEANTFRTICSLKPT